MDVASPVGLEPRDPAQGDGVVYLVTDLIGSAQAAGALGSQDDGPQAFIVDARRTQASRAREVVIAPHFHQVRQFQVLLSGDCAAIGKYPVGPFDFHYADPSSPYGPFMAGPGGVRFLTLRPRGDRGIHYMPGSKAKMRARAGRNIVVSLPSYEGKLGSDTLLPEHEDGLTAARLGIAPGAKVLSPQTSSGGGQYLVVNDGTLIIGGQPLPRESVVWLDRADGPQELTSATDGAVVLVLQFPVAPPTEVTESDLEMLAGDRA